MKTNRKRGLLPTIANYFDLNRRAEIGTLRRIEEGAFDQVWESTIRALNDDQENTNRRIEQLEELVAILQERETEYRQEIQAVENVVANLRKRELDYEERLKRERNTRFVDTSLARDEMAKVLVQRRIRTEVQTSVESNHFPIFSLMLTIFIIILLLV